MNIGEHPEGMSAERRDLIETLECLGYDTMPGVQRDWSDWRDRLPDEQLRAIIANIKDMPEAPDTLIEAKHGADNEYPDISEMVEAITKSEAALAAIQRQQEAGLIDLTPLKAAAGKRVLTDALHSCRTILSQIAKAQEA